MKKIVFVYLSVFFVAACDTEVKMRPSFDISDTEVVYDAKNRCQDNNYLESKSAINRFLMTKEEKEKKSALSGDIDKLSPIVKIENVTNSYEGLIFDCGAKNLTFTLDCNGTATLTRENEVISQNLDEILAMQEIYVDNASLCGTLTLKQNATFFMNAGNVKFDNFSIQVEGGSLLSLSIHNLENSNGLRDVQLDPKGTLSIHVWKDLTK